MIYDLDFEYNNHSFVAEIKLSLDNASFDHSFGTENIYAIDWKFKSLSLVRNSKSKKINVDDMNNGTWSQLFKAIGLSFENDYSKIERFYLK